MHGLVAESKDEHFISINKITFIIIILLVQLITHFSLIKAVYTISTLTSTSMASKIATFTKFC